MGFGTDPGSGSARRGDFRWIIAAGKWIYSRSASTRVGDADRHPGVGFDHPQGFRRCAHRAGQRSKPWVGYSHRWIGHKMMNNPTARLEARTGSPHQYEAERCTSMSAYQRPLGSSPPQTLPGAWIRFAALLIDMVASAVLLLPIAFAVGAIGLTHELSDLTSRLIVAALILLYFAGFQAWVGWTPGMRLLGMRVRGPGDANKPSFAAALIRNCYLLLFLATPDTDLYALIDFALLIAIGYTIAKSPARQGIHDQLAGGTRVVAYRPEGSTGLP
ncbi:RDD family protein [Nocardia nepalensis]|uniref:RDD family protein n=1 Tax=Nocardia nepalensis TaxID=3375448 RepID=UPI003B67EF79